MIETAEFVFWASGATVFCFILAASMVRVMDTAVARVRREKIKAPAPQVTGVVTLRDGIERLLVLDIAALCEVEKLSSMALAQMFTSDRVSALRDLLFVGLRRGGSRLDADAVAGLMDYNRRGEYTAVIAGMLKELAG